MKKTSRFPIVLTGALLGAGFVLASLGKSAPPVAEGHAPIASEELGVAPSSPPSAEVNTRESASLSGSDLHLGQVRPSLRLTPRQTRLAAMVPSREKPAQLPPAKDAGDAKVADELRVSQVLGKGLGATPRNSASTASPPMPMGMDQAPSKAEDARSETVIALGAGLDRVPRWAGSKRSEIRPIPYIDINWQDRVEFSTVKGLIIDGIYGERWHGGLVGTMVWGRSRRELSGLQVPTLQNTVQGGVYLEYALTKELTLGTRLRHDLQNTGVYYGDIYAELALPKVGYLEHDIRINQEAMNRRGMNRFFGITAQDAARLGVSEYSPKAGASRTSLTYEGFQPMSESTGIAFAANLSRLNAGAGNSPLVRNFGSTFQTEFVAAFVYHF